MPKKNAQDLEKETLQALVLGDSFLKAFRPLTLDLPKVLLPLVNVPLIEYTLEMLSANDVEEIFIVVSWKAEAVKEYLRGSRWTLAEGTGGGGGGGGGSGGAGGYGGGFGSATSSSSSSSSSSSASNSSSFNSGPLVHIITSDVTNAGDAIREMETLNVIRSDPFVLLTGDTVANVDLRPAIAAHKLRRSGGGRSPEDKYGVMTMCMKRVGSPCHRTAPLSTDLVVFMDPESGQLLAYSDDQRNATASIPASRVAAHAKAGSGGGAAVSVRYDLCDCGVDICSPEVLGQIADNYDYQDLRRDYVVNELANADLGFRWVWVVIAAAAAAAAVGLEVLSCSVSHLIISPQTASLSTRSVTATPPGATTPGRMEQWPQTWCGGGHTPCPPTATFARRFARPTGSAAAATTERWDWTPTTRLPAAPVLWVASAPRQCLASTSTAAAPAAVPVPMATPARASRSRARPR